MGFTLLPFLFHSNSVLCVQHSLCDKMRNWAWYSSSWWAEFLCSWLSLSHFMCHERMWLTFSGRLVWWHWQLFVSTSIWFFLAVPPNPYACKLCLSAIKCNLYSLSQVQNLLWVNHGQYAHRYNTWLSQYWCVTRMSVKWFSGFLLRNV